MVETKRPQLLSDIDSLRPAPEPDCLRGLELEQVRVECECLLDELVFYMLRLGFPQSLINLLLSMLSDDRLKERFSCRFFQWYGLIDGLLHEVLAGRAPLDSHEPSKIAARVIHASVQICSSKSVCLLLQQRVNVLRKVLESGLRMVYSSATAVQASHRE